MAEWLRRKRGHTAMLSTKFQHQPAMDNTKSLLLLWTWTIFILSDIHGTDSLEGSLQAFKA